MEWHQRNIPQKSYLGLREVELNLMMAEACGATNCTMMGGGQSYQKYDEGAWSYHKELYKVNFYLYGNR